uniref:Ig-like domain-containing protein n=1 Tax=Salmo trutta TaxID=8032 RepID=A0A673VYT6_SALTR
AVSWCCAASLPFMLHMVHAVAGGDVILPCFLKPTMNAASHTVEWLRPDLKPKEAHCYRDHRDSEEDQNPSYKRRTSLFKEELKNGNVSLKLTGVTLSDAGNYTCFIPTMSRTQRPVVQLLVGESSILPATGPTETETDTEGFYTVRRNVTIQQTDNNWFTCRVQQQNITRTKQIRIPGEGSVLKRLLNLQLEVFENVL